MGAQIVLDIMFTLKLPGKLLAAGITVLALFVATNAYAATPPYQWVLFTLGICLLGLLFERMQAGVRQRLAELPSTAVGPLYIAMVSQKSDKVRNESCCGSSPIRGRRGRGLETSRWQGQCLNLTNAHGIYQPRMVIIAALCELLQVAFFGMWPLFPIIFLLGPNWANALDRLAFSIIHACLDVICKGVLALALLRVRAQMENAGWYGYSLGVAQIRDRLVARLADASKSGATGTAADVHNATSSTPGEQSIRMRN